MKTCRYQWGYAQRQGAELGAVAGLVHAEEAVRRRTPQARPIRLSGGEAAHYPAIAKRPVAAIVSQVIAASFLCSRYPIERGAACHSLRKLALPDD
ncbi:MAG: hypothetical protein WCF84_14135 [Anaerolineae bacterium]